MGNLQLKQCVVTNMKSIFGKGPDSVKICISENIAIMDIKGSLTPLENSLLRCNPGNKEVVKNIRKQLLDFEIGNINAEIQNITQNKPQAMLETAASGEPKVKIHLDDMDFGKY
jgi:uncharacterized protein YbcI